MIKTIFFDLDDTLLWDEKSIKESFRKTTEIAQKKYGVDPRALEDAVRSEARQLYSSYETYEFTKMIGINPFEALWGDFFDEGESFKKLSNIVPTYRVEAWTRGLKTIGIDRPTFGEELSESFREERKKHPFVYEDTFLILDQLKGNYKLVLLTNGSPSLQKAKLQITPTLLAYFDEIVISGDFGKGKPHPSIFEYALSLINENKENVLMVGDNLMTDILGANRAGIKTVWINRHNKRRNEVIPSYEIQQLQDLINILHAHHRTNSKK